MNQRSAIAAVLTTTMIAGCSINVSPAPKPTLLVSATGRTIPTGTALAFSFDPEAGRRVTISVQANTDRADPDFQVVRGKIDFEDLGDTPISDLVLFSADEGSGQEIDFFTPETAESYTLFITDANDWPGATFSVSVTQR